QNTSAVTADDAPSATPTTTTSTRDPISVNPPSRSIGNHDQVLEAVAEPLRLRPRGVPLTLPRARPPRRPLRAGGRPTSRSTQGSHPLPRPPAPPPGCPGRPPPDRGPLDTMERPARFAMSRCAQ